MKYIYLLNMEGTDIYKIGVTKQKSKDRIAPLQTGNPFKIIIVDKFETPRANKLEKVLHRFMRSKKYIVEDGLILEGEWFKMDLSDVQNFNQTCKKIDENLRIIEENSTLYNKKPRL